MILATPERFTALVAPPQDRTGPALWFAFQGAQILVVHSEAGASLPRAEHPSEIGVAPRRSQYLGMLGEQHCYACELDEDCTAPSGMQWSGLRALFGALDDAQFAIAGRAFQIMDWDRSHQFCGRCGTPTRLKANERARECPSCGQVHYPRIAPAIMALVRRGREFLLARSPHFAPGMYSALAGFVEPGETLEQTLVREVREEVGIEVANVRYFASQPWPFPHSLMIAFNADYAGGEIVPAPGEIEAAGWFAPERLPQMLPGKISISRRLIDATLAELGTPR
ncbi:MAG TPA: NAD(+) diphosphatase [Burkholderiales bacterium]|nr:NAD(+) diphosphatase [Burkholderiales bacterium]